MYLLFIAFAVFGSPLQASQIDVPEARIIFPLADLNQHGDSLLAYQSKITVSGTVPHTEHK